MSEFELDAIIDIPDDDDMPPLVDRLPPAMGMMTYSFDAELTPIPYNPDSPSVVDLSPESVLRFELVSEEDVPRISATRPSHAKKRDAGHIPRPPNAFILFRSSFIKSESVPGNIEGNHSTLSKIIGIVWKTLPPAERELWEKRAVQAQAEHRTRYPDWRFRPGTNVDAIAKRKTKDKNKDRPPPERRRRNPTAPRDKVTVTGGGGGRCKSKTGGLMQERRCAQIAELLARGVKGVALSSAVQAWDKESGVGTVSDGMFVAEEGGVVDSQSPRIAQNDARGRKEMWRAKDTEVTTTATTTTTTKTRSASIAQQARFNVPLTSMFRRASSVPLALVPDHEIAVQNATAVTIWAPDHTQDSVGGVVPDFYPPPLSPASSISYESEVSFPDSDNTSFPAMFDFVPFSPPDSPCSSIIDNNNNNQNQNHDLVTPGPINPLLSIVGPAGPATDPSTLNHFFSVSSYSSLCDWAGADTLTVTAAATATDNYGAKMTLAYGDITDHHYPFSCLPAVAAATAVDPWNNNDSDNVLELITRPLFGGLEDASSWAGARVVTAGPYA